MSIVRHVRNHPGLALLALALLAAASAAGWVLGLRAWADWQYRAAVRAAEEHDLGRAREHLARCLRARPGDGRALLLAARTARRGEAYDDARRYLDALEALQGLTPDVSLERALALAQRGDLRGVEDDLRAMVDDNHPDTPHILEALAGGYLATYQLSFMLDSLDLLRERWPDHVGGCLLRGRCLEDLDRAEEALADYERAVELAPRSGVARLHLAGVLHQLGRPREAVASYEAALMLRPGDPTALVGLALCRHDLNDRDEAARLLDALLAEHPDHVAGLVERNRLRVRAGRAAEAEAGLRRAVALAPTDRAALRTLLLCLQAQGKEESGDVRRRLDRVEAALMRCRTLKTKLHPEAPPDPRIHCEIGMLLLSLRQDAEAVRWLQSALQIDAHFAPAHAALATHFEQAGRAEEARHHRRAAQRGSPPGGPPR